MVRRPGTKTISPTIDPLTPGDTNRIALESLTDDRGKKGYLKKYMPFGSVIVDSYSDSVRLEASVNGGEFHPVPKNTARTFDSVGVNQVAIKNPSGSGANVVADDIKIILFTSEQQLREETTSFTPQQMLKDLIPGVN